MFIYVYMYMYFWDLGLGVQGGLMFVVERLGLGGWGLKLLGLRV
jgi:hypothetical protein